MTLSGEMTETISFMLRKKTSCHATDEKKRPCWSKITGTEFYEI